MKNVVDFILTNFITFFTLEANFTIPSGSYIDHKKLMTTDFQTIQRPDEWNDHPK